MSRPILIAGNWKMNCGPGEAAGLLGSLTERLDGRSAGVDILVCPPFVSIPAAAEILQDKEEVQLGAQDVHYEDEGAFTGEVSTGMLLELGCSHVIVGHSERREYFGETNSTVNRKLIKVLSDGMRPILCVGESLRERKGDTHRKRVRKQVEAALTGVEREKAGRVIVAYEPLWAIGTGETATPEQAQEMHAMIRESVAERTSESVAESLLILYGGSMKPHNAASLLGQVDVDGGLVGGASLEAESFASIVEIAEQI